VTPVVRTDALARAEPGVVFKVVGVEGDWYLVEYRHERWGQRRGYIHKDSVRRTPNAAGPSMTHAKADPETRPESCSAAITPPVPAPRQLASREVSAPRATTQAVPALEKAKLDGYVEWQRTGYLIADGQRVLWDERTRMKLPPGVSGASGIPVGYELKVKGFRIPNGAVVARDLEAKPNRTALLRMR